jgi:putative membrane protein insertion efficiency factor
VIKIFFVFLVKIYQILVSPFLGANCRFHPSCSQYSLDCFQRLTFLQALWYSVRRITKCHPFNKGGYDPAPIIDIFNTSNKSELKK